MLLLRIHKHSGHYPAKTTRWEHFITSRAARTSRKLGAFCSQRCPALKLELLRRRTAGQETRCLEDRIRYRSTVLQQSIQTPASRYLDIIRFGQVFVPSPERDSRRQPLSGQDACCSAICNLRSLPCTAAPFSPPAPGVSYQTHRTPTTICSSKAESSYREGCWKRPKSPTRNSFVDTSIKWYPQGDILLTTSSAPLLRYGVHWLCTQGRTAVLQKRVKWNVLAPSWARFRMEQDTATACNWLVQNCQPAVEDCNAV